VGIVTRICHLITRFLNGGAETTTGNTIRALLDAPDAYEVHLGFGAAHDEDRVREIESLGVETQCFRTLRHYNPVTQMAAIGSIAAYLARHDIEIVHTHSTEAGIVGRFAACLADVPVVIHEVHGDPITVDRSDIFNTALKTLERAAAKCSSIQIVKSERIKETYLDRGIGRPKQYSTIYHGVELDTYNSATPAADPPLRRDHRLLFVGRLAEGKGLFDLLNAVERLDNRHDFELLIAGGGPLADQLSEVITARGLDDRVSILGYRSDVPELLASADVFVLPSYREGTPRVITEALAVGVPVVATDIAGIPEQVRDGETGLLFEPADVGTLVERLDQLLGDDDYRAKLAANTDRGLEKFRLETVQQQYRDLYQDLSASL